MIRSMVKRLLVGGEPLRLQDRGQEFFPRHLESLIESPADARALSLLFHGAALITALGGPPRGQLLQDAFAAGVVSRIGGEPTYLEIGGGPPVDHSNSESLDRLGWRGVVVEPNPEFADQYAAVRSARTTLRQTAVVADTAGQTHMRLVSAGELSYVEGAVTPPDDVWKSMRDEARGRGDLIQVPVVAARDLWADVVGAIGVPSFLSVDVEGGEIDVLRSLPLQDERPMIVMAETSLDAERIREMDHLMSDRGFVRVLAAASQWDNWYLSSEADLDAGLLADPSR